VVGLYWLAVLGWTRAVKLVANRLGTSVLILVGAGMLVLGYASGAVGQSLASVGAAAILVRRDFAFMHSTLQTWATEVVPESRATMISLFEVAERMLDEQTEFVQHMTKALEHAERENTSDGRCGR